MNRPIHFEVPVDNVERAQSFYTKAFGWQFILWDGPQPYWLIKTGEGSPGIDGGMMNRQAPGHMGMNTIVVADLDASIKTVQQAGGTIILPKMAVPGIGWLAYANDTEGNSFGMMQNDPAAK